MSHNIEFILITCCWNVRALGYIDLALMWENIANISLLLLIVGTIKFVSCTPLPFCLLSLVGQDSVIVCMQWNNFVPALYLL